MAALRSILRRSAYSVGPLALRLVSNRATHHQSALFAAVSRAAATFPAGFARQLRFYSVAKRPNSDETLMRIINSEIKCAAESDDHNQTEAVPEGFPFSIEDNPGQQTISLAREYQGESISVEVHMPNLVTGDDEGGNDADDDNDHGNQSSIPLVVSISKRDGPSLEFGCTAFPDEIAIDSLSIKNPEFSEDQIAYEGPDFSDLDENLQKAFHKYLEIRGIKPSTTNFLHEYMINKDSREYMAWLQNLKKFVEA